MSKKRRTIYQKVLPKGPNGYNLCRCGCKCECLPPRLTFFSSPCVHEYRLRSDPSYLRKCVFERDKGICSTCGLDCELLKLEMAVLRHKDKHKYKKKMKQLGWQGNRKTYWDCHHIIPVADGGGECSDLSKFSTLCLKCHIKETQRWLKNRVIDNL